MGFRHRLRNSTKCRQSWTSCVLLTYSPTLAVKQCSVSMEARNQIELSAPEISYKSIASYGPPVLILPRMWCHSLLNVDMRNNLQWLATSLAPRKVALLGNISARILRYCKFPLFLAVKVTATMRLENALCNISLRYLINVVKWGQSELIYIRLPNRKILNAALHLFVMKMLLFC